MCDARAGHMCRSWIMHAPAGSRGAAHSSWIPGHCTLQLHPGALRAPAASSGVSRPLERVLTLSQILAAYPGGGSPARPLLHSEGFASCQITPPQDRLDWVPPKVAADSAMRSGNLHTGVLILEKHLLTTIVICSTAQGSAAKRQRTAFSCESSSSTEGGMEVKMRHVGHVSLACEAALNKEATLPILGCIVWLRHGASFSALLVCCMHRGHCAASGRHR